MWQCLKRFLIAGIGGGVLLASSDGRPKIQGCCSASYSIQDCPLQQSIIWPQVSTISTVRTSSFDSCFLCQNPHFCFCFQRNFLVYKCNCLKVGTKYWHVCNDKADEMYPLQCIVQSIFLSSVPRNGSFYAHFGPVMFFPAWHSVPTQLLLWSIHARSKGFGKSHSQVKIDLKTYLPFVWLMDIVTFRCHADKLPSSSWSTSNSFHLISCSKPLYHIHCRVVKLPLI